MSTPVSSSGDEKKHGWRDDEAQQTDAQMRKFLQYVSYRAQLLTCYSHHCDNGNRPKAFLVQHHGHYVLPPDPCPRGVLLLHLRR